MVPNALDVIDDGLGLIADGQPFDIFAGTRTWFAADVAEAFGGELGSLETGSQQFPHHVIGEEFHAAVGVMNHEEFAGAEKLVADDQGTDGIVTGAAAGIADHVGVAFGEAGEFRGIEARVHAGQDGEAARRWESQLALLAKLIGIFAVGFEDFRKNLTHDFSPRAATWLRRRIYIT